MLKIIFNTLLGIVLIFVWSRFVNIGEIFAILAKINLSFLIPMLLFLLLSPILRALRLQILLSEIKKIRFLDLIYLNGAAMMFNFFIPIRAGEIAKGLYLNTTYHLPLGKSVIWIFIDRFVDFLAVLILASLLFFIVPTSLNITFMTIIIIILTLALLLTYLVIHQANLAKKLIRFKFTHFILDSFKILDRHPGDLIKMMGITVLAYGADAAVWYFSFRALGVNEGYFKMYLGQLLSALTYLIPAAPGYVGSAEASGLLVLSGVLGLNPNLASAMTVLYHITVALFVLIFGLISVYSLKIKVGTLLKRALNRS